MSLGYTASFWDRKRNFSLKSEEPKECIANDWKRKVILLFLKKRKIAI